MHQLLCYYQSLSFFALLRENLKLIVSIQQMTVIFENVNILCGFEKWQSDIASWLVHLLVATKSVSLYFSALTLLFRHQEEHPACKNWVMRCWCGCLSGVRYRLYACGPSDAIVSKTPSSVASFKSRLFLPFWYRLTQVVLEKRSLSG